MTTPGPPAAPVDTGNPLLAETPSVLFTALVPSPQGQRLALTIRTPSTTLTVLLAQPDAAAWAENIAAKVAGMSSAGLVVASGNGHIRSGLNGEPR